MPATRLDPAAFFARAATLLDTPPHALVEAQLRRGTEVLGRRGMLCLATRAAVFIEDEALRPGRHHRLDGRDLRAVGETDTYLGTEFSLLLAEGPVTLSHLHADDRVVVRGWLDATRRLREATEAASARAALLTVLRRRAAVLASAALPPPAAPPRALAPPPPPAPALPPAEVEPAVSAPPDEAAPTLAEPAPDDAAEDAVGWGKIVVALLFAAYTVWHFW